MKKIFRTILVIIFILVFRLFYSWSTRTFEMSSAYIAETAAVLISGIEVNGVIEKISKNTEVAVSNNYLATVSYATLDNQKMTRDFRYAEGKIPLETQVHVLYNQSNPLKAALKEDANYFKYTCYGILGFLTFFVVSLAGTAYLIYRLGKTKTNTVS